MNATLFIHQAEAHLKILNACAQLTDDPQQVVALLDAKLRIAARLAELQARQRQKSLEPGGLAA